MKQQPSQSLAARHFQLQRLTSELAVSLNRIKGFHLEVLQKISALVSIVGFNVSISPQEIENSLMITWSCKNRREGISSSESKEIEAMISNVESVGFKAISQTHDTHSITATFKQR